jgi:hypothetical protein
MYAGYQSHMYAGYQSHMYRDAQHAQHLSTRLVPRCSASIMVHSICIA